LSGIVGSEPVRLALNIADPALADRLAKLLAGVPGIQLVAPGEPAEILVTTSSTAAQADGDPILTPRELEVLALLAEGASNSHRPPAWHIRTHRQVPRRLASGQARCGRAHRCRGPRGPSRRH